MNSNKMAFNPEEFEMMLDDYGIVVSERTRRLIHRNIKKREPVHQKEVLVKENTFLLWAIIKCIALFLKSILYKLLSYIIYLIALLIWIVLGIIQIMLEIYVAAIICYVVVEFIKQI